jgi:bacterioferritin-associated ferredoxin
MDAFCYDRPCDEGTDAIVCHCLQVRESELIEVLAVREAGNLRDIRRAIGAGDGCTACHARLREYIRRYASPAASPICSVR